MGIVVPHRIDPYDLERFYANADFISVPKLRGLDQSDYSDAYRENKIV